MEKRKGGGGGSIFENPNMFNDSHLAINHEKDDTWFQVGFKKTWTSLIKQETYNKGQLTNSEQK